VAGLIYRPQTGSAFGSLPPRSRVELNSLVRKADRRHLKAEYYSEACVEQEEPYVACPLGVICVAGLICRPQTGSAFDCRSPRLRVELNSWVRKADRRAKISWVDFFGLRGGPAHELYSLVREADRSARSSRLNS
jgi:hypothetical protein